MDDNNTLASERLVEALSKLPLMTDAASHNLYDLTRLHHWNLYFLQIEFATAWGRPGNMCLESTGLQMQSTLRTRKLRHINLFGWQLAFAMDWTPPWGDVRNGRVRW